MFIGVYAWKFICMCECLEVYMYVRVFRSVYVCASVYRCICMEVVYMYVRVFRSVYVCASVYRCICTCFLCVDKRSLI